MLPKPKGAQHRERRNNREKKIWWNPFESRTIHIENHSMHNPKLPISKESPNATTFGPFD